MMTAKRLYKLIISAFVTALCFVVFSLTAFADPLTGAMIAAGIADGFVWGGMAGMSANGISSSLNKSGGYTDPLDWTTGDFNVKITHNSEDNTKVDIELSPDLSTVGNRRIEQFNTAFGLSPGTLHSFGTKYGIRGYDLYQMYNGTYFGDIVETINFSPQSLTSYLYSDIYCYFDYESTSGSSYYFYSTPTIGTKTGTRTYTGINNTHPWGIRWGYNVNNNAIWPYLFYNNEWKQIASLTNLSSSGISPSTYYPTASRTADSEIIDPLGQANTVTLPATYVQNITYVEGQTIDTRAVVEEVLDAITVAGGNDDIDDSVYLPPPGPAPTPVPGETIADTPYSDLHGDLGDVSDTIGIGNGVLEDIKDILDNTTDGLKDTVEDISDALTSTVDGIKKGVNTISQTLTGIATHVAQLVQEIVDADYNWTSGVINNFFNAFTDWFSTLRSHVSIWHYVVEWLSDISTCFAFFWGVQSAAGYRFILPIYAAFAGTVVIAIYRRFGK